MVEDGESTVDKAKTHMIVHIKEVERNIEEKDSTQKEIQNGVIIIITLDLNLKQKRLKLMFQRLSTLSI